MTLYRCIFCNIVCEGGDICNSCAGDCPSFQDFCGYTGSGKARRAYAEALRRIELWQKRWNCAKYYEVGLGDIILENNKFPDDNYQKSKISPQDGGFKVFKKEE